MTTTGISPPRRGSGAVQVTSENGSTTVFTPGTGGYAAPPRVFATLTKNPDGTWTFVRHQRQRFVFDASGRLTAISDLNGYTTALSYNASNQLITVSDPARRLLTYSYGPNGKIASVTDPVGRTVSYGYNASGNLTTVTDVAGGIWTFGYDANNLMTSMTDPRGGTISNVYDATGHVISQTDAAGRSTTFSYGPSSTTITDPSGNVTVDSYTQGQLVSVTKGFGTPSAATWQYSYDPATLGLTSETDPNGNGTTYSYSAGSYNPTSSTDALDRTTTTTYNLFEEPLTVTDPAGVTTSYTYDASGNPTSVSRPWAVPVPPRRPATRTSTPRTLATSPVPPTLMVTSHISAMTLTAALGASRGTHTRRGDLMDVDAALQSQIRNIETTYGKPFDHWFAVVDSSGLTKHTEVVAMLKGDHGLAHGAAHRISLLARQRAAAGAAAPADPASALYAGAKAGLRPLHDALLGEIRALGALDIAPKKGYLSLRRRK